MRKQSHRKKWRRKTDKAENSKRARGKAMQRKSVLIKYSISVMSNGLMLAAVKQVLGHQLENGALPDPRLPSHVHHLASSHY
jgi:hypothetical protein